MRSLLVKSLTSYPLFTLAGILGALVVFSPTLKLSKAATGASLEQGIESAKTKADHEAIAVLYEQEAKTLQEKAEKHLGLANRYGSLGSYETVKGGMVEHCNAIARKYQEAAKEYLELAKLHREMAAQAQQ